jgi:hypothetical protein
VQILEQKEETEYHEILGYDVRWLRVKIMFLQYCKASKKKSRLSEIAEDPNATQQEFAEAFGEQATHIDDYIVPKLRCNYRTTIFLTRYSADGKELSTTKTIPVAPRDPVCKSCLTEIMPGETIWVDFILSADPNPTPETQVISWHVWVPK